jgi:hypothetical protein
MPNPDDAPAAAAARANALLPLANAGDRRALAELRRVLDGAPDLWLSAGNVAAQAQYSMIRAAAGDNDVTREAIERKLGQLRRDLGGPDAPLLDRLLVDRVVAGWLALSYAEAQYAQRLGGGMGWEESGAHQRQIDRCHRRYLAAIKTLAVVRRFLVPVVQLNVAEAGAQQLNVVGPPKRPRRPMVKE